MSGDQKGPRIAEEVGSRPASVTILWLISSTNLSHYQLAVHFTLPEKHSRLDAQNVAHAPRLIAVLPVGLADGIDVVDADDPLVLCELDVAAEVVEM